MGMCDIRWRLGAEMMHASMEKHLLVPEVVDRNRSVQQASV